MKITEYAPYAFFKISTQLQHAYMDFIMNVLEIGFKKSGHVLIV